jgi:hypothetical protein
VEFAHAEGLTIGEEKSDWSITEGGQASNLPTAVTVADGQSIVPTEVIASGSHILLTLPQPIPDRSTPLFVSLGDRDYAEIHIHNASGLSAMPFRIKVE